MAVGDKVAVGWDVTVGEGVWVGWGATVGSCVLVGSDVAFGNSVGTDAEVCATAADVSGKFVGLQAPSNSMASPINRPERRENTFLSFLQTKLSSQ